VQHGGKFVYPFVVETEVQQELFNLVGLSQIVQRCSPDQSNALEVDRCWPETP
jgi:hypothetical protein